MEKWLFIHSKLSYDDWMEFKKMQEKANEANILLEFGWNLKGKE